MQRGVVRLCVLHADPQEVYHASRSSRHRRSLRPQHTFTAWAGGNRRQPQQVSTLLLIIPARERTKRRVLHSAQERGRNGPDRRARQGNVDIDIDIGNLSVLCIKVIISGICTQKCAAYTDGRPIRYLRSADDANQNVDIRDPCMKYTYPSPRRLPFRTDARYFTFSCRCSWYSAACRGMSPGYHLPWDVPRLCPRQGPR